MVQHHRYHQLKKGFREEQQQQGDEESQSQTLVLDLGNTSSCYRRTKLKLLPLVFFFFTFFCFSLIFVPRCINLYSMEVEHVAWVINGDAKSSLCSSMASGSICCDRTSIRSDICFMKGDVRTDSASSSIFVYSSNDTMVGNYTENSSNYIQEEEDLVAEKVKPYTRKWETSIMDTVDELDLIVKRNGSEVSSPCDVQHSVPAVVFSTGGYTGNVYHEFNDGLIPLYITSQHLNRNVVFVMLEYHEWWMTKYGDVVSRLSKYPPIDFNNDRRTHCFPEVIVGLRIHDELSVDRSRMLRGKSIRDFHNLLDKAYWPRIQGLIQDEEAEAQLSPISAAVELKRKKDIQKPKLVIVSRNGSRAITNQHLMVNIAEEIGFEVKVLEPDRTTELAKIYRVLNSSDVMIGVHGAAMTHFLFMKPGTVFIQVIPLGTDWAAETYYGEPSRKLGLNYIEYNVLPSESSLYEKYNKDDPVLRDPKSVNAKGWEFTKKIYLDGQNVNLDLERFRKRLIRAYDYTISKRRRAMSEDMVKDGYEDITNIDISSVAISMMRKKYEDIPQLKYTQMDVRDMSSFPDDSFDSVIDKGTLDSLMCGTNAPLSASQMLGEVSRVLKPGGIYMLITYGDPRVRIPHLNRAVYSWKIMLYIIPRPGFEKPADSSSSLKSFMEPVPVTEEGFLPPDFSLEDPESHYIYVCKKVDEFVDIGSAMIN